MEFVEEEQYYDDPPQYQRQLPRGLYPEQLATLPGQSPDFMRWLFDLRERVITPLKYSWKGYELNESGTYVPKQGGKRIMNDEGISWAIDLIESYINPAYIISNYIEKWFNYTMNEVCWVIVNNLCSRYKQFELHKLDIRNVGLQIESKIQAILLGARGDGYRRFFGSTHHVQETKMQMDNNQRKPSILGSVFKKKEPDITQY